MRLTMDSDDIWTAEIADRYDESSAAMFAPEILGPTVDFLTDLAGDGRALELAIGTGRVAVPLAARGVPVAGIELSRPMVAKLEEKPGAEGIEVVVGDMAEARVDGEFAVVYLVYNTIGNVLTQEAQVACFQNAARHLQPGGCFVVEVGVPNLQRLPLGETIAPFLVGEDRWGFDEFDLVTQQAVSHHFAIRDGGVKHFACPFRYVWPAELDLMAQLAGMTLRERWEDWDRTPFTADSRHHVSVWEKPLS